MCTQRARRPPGNEHQPSAAVQPRSSVTGPFCRPSLCHSVTLVGRGSVLWCNKRLTTATDAAQPPNHPNHPNYPAYPMRLNPLSTRRQEPHVGTNDLLQSLLPGKSQCPHLPAHICRHLPTPGRAHLCHDRGRKLAGGQRRVAWPGGVHTKVDSVSRPSLGACTRAVIPLGASSRRGQPDKVWTSRTPDPSTKVAPLYVGAFATPRSPDWQPLLKLPGRRRPRSPQSQTRQ
eukprot:361078-Chlamydomonas_euryale.AAC.2